MQIKGEFDDTALMKVFAESGRGLTIAPLAIEKELSAQFGLELVGVIPHALERFYAISVERKLKHPAVKAMSQEAKKSIFL